jgi:uncharacterized protein YkwD
MRTSLVGRLVGAALVGLLSGAGTIGAQVIDTSEAERIEVEASGERVGGEAGGARIDSEECRLLGKINKFRRQNGAKPLELAADLNAAADHHSDDMARRDYFSHNLKGGPSWSANIRRFGYKSSPIGENIAAGPSGADGAFKLWKNSRGHRENMLRESFEAIGIGRAFDRGSKYDWYWTTTFGGRVENKVNCG